MCRWREAARAAAHKKGRHAKRRAVPSGGVGGIRTRVPLITATRFPVVLVMTSSIPLHMGFSRRGAVLPHRGCSTARVIIPIFSREVKQKIHRFQIFLKFPLPPGRPGTPGPGSGRMPPDRWAAPGMAGVPGAADRRRRRGGGPMCTKRAAAGLPRGGQKKETLPISKIFVPIGEETC